MCYNDSIDKKINMKKIIFSLLLMITIISGKADVRAAQNNDLSTPPPGTVIKKDNSLVYINEMGEEVFLTYKSGKIKKKDIARKERVNKFRGSRYTKKEPMLFSSAPKEVEKKARTRLSFRNSKRNENPAERARIIREYRKNKENAIINHRVVKKSEESRILRKKKTDFTALKEAQSNSTKRAKIAAEAERNKKKYDISRIKKSVPTDFTALRETSQNVKTKQLSAEVDEQIAKFLKDLDE